MKTLIIIFLGCIFAIPAQAEKNKIIIQNKAQNVVAPALIPSKSNQLRSARQDAELDTESVILQKLEADRLKDEQKRLNKILGGKNPVPSATTSEAVAAQKVSTSYVSNFLNRGFISLGLGSVGYPGVENISSTETPAYFFSFGGYGYGNFIFDLNLYYSTHYLIPIDNNLQAASTYRQAVRQPSAALAVKFSPLRDRIKPYAGFASSFVARRWVNVTKDGKYIEEAISDSDVGAKKWRNSLDLGVVLGADIALGNRLGLNFDIRYYMNQYTETRNTVNTLYQKVLDERDSTVVSINLRYYL